MFKKDHITDSQFTLIEKNPSSGEIIEEPLTEASLSPSSVTSPSFLDTHILTSPQSLSKIRGKITKNLRPNSYLSLTSSPSSGSNATFDQSSPSSPQPNNNSNSHFMPHVYPSLSPSTSSSSSSGSSFCCHNNISNPIPINTTQPNPELLKLLAAVDPANERLTGKIFHILVPVFLK